MRPFITHSYVPSLFAALGVTMSVGVFCAAAVSAMPPQSTVSQIVISNGSVVSKGTLIRLRLETDLRSGRDKVGAPILFTVDQNVYSPNHLLLLKQGAVARGHVVESAGHGPFGRSGKLTFTSDYALTEDGRKIPLHLLVTPGPGSGASGASDGTRGEVAASVSTGARGYEPYYGREGYSEGYVQSATPGSYYQQAGVSGSIVFDPGRLFGSGQEVTADRGHAYDATVTADTVLDSTVSVPQPSPLTVPSQALFTLRDRTQVTGTLAGYDGQNYTVNTISGRRIIRAADLESIEAISSDDAVSPKQ